MSKKKAKKAPKITNTTVPTATTRSDKPLVEPVQTPFAIFLKETEAYYVYHMSVRIADKDKQDHAGIKKNKNGGWVVTFQNCEGQKKTLANLDKAIVYAKTQLLPIFEAFGVKDEKYWSAAAKRSFQ